MMSASEARDAIATIRGHLDTAAALILDLHDREGWRALNYRTWGECIEKEFDVSRSRGYQLLDSARLSTIVDTAIPEAHARELAPLLRTQPAAIPATYRNAVATATSAGRKVTARDVRVAVTAAKAPPPLPSSVHISSGRDEVVARYAGQALRDLFDRLDCLKHEIERTDFHAAITTTPHPRRADMAAAGQGAIGAIRDLIQEIEEAE